MKRKALEEQTFGRLKVLEFTGKRTKTGKAIWRCQCNCENKTIVEVIGDNLTKRENNTMSCGCYSRDLLQMRKDTAKRNSPLYSLWNSIKRRCCLKIPPFIISECWLNPTDGFYNFESWCFSNGWQKGLQLDRKENDKGYSPDNCRFISNKENCRNKTNNKIVNPWDKGAVCLAEAVEKYAIKGVEYTHVRRRLKRGWTIEDALATPLLSSTSVRNT